MPEYTDWTTEGSRENVPCQITPLTITLGGRLSPVSWFSEAEMTSADSEFLRRVRQIPPHGMGLSVDVYTPDLTRIRRPMNGWGRYSLNDQSEKPIHEYPYARYD